MDGIKSVFMLLMGIATGLVALFLGLAGVMTPLEGGYGVGVIFLVVALLFGYICFRCIRRFRWLGQDRKAQQEGSEAVIDREMSRREGIGHSKVVNNHQLLYRGGFSVPPASPMFLLDLEGSDLLLLEIDKRTADKSKTYRIPLENIVLFETMTERELRSKSALGRGIVGGVLMGETGAVLGGLSGTGTKEVLTMALTIVYASASAPGAPKALLFDATNGTWQMQNMKAIKKIQRVLKEITPSQLAQSCMEGSRNEDGSIDL